MVSKYGVTPLLMQDANGYLFFRKKSGTYRWRVNLFNSAGFVCFTQGEPDAYGVILRAGRYQEKAGRPVRKYGYVLRYFDPPETTADQFPLHTLEEIQELMQSWQEELKTGYKTIPLSKLGLTQYREDFRSSVPLSRIYLGRYRCPYNPSWIVSTGAKVARHRSEIEEFNRRVPLSVYKPKLRQKRSPRRNQLSLCALSGVALHPPRTRAQPDTKFRRVRIR